MTLRDEIESNFEKFQLAWPGQAQDNWKKLGGEAAYLQSYVRICAFAAIRNELIEPNASLEAHSFALEAHNDVLTSHVLASTGAWRSALQSLRSFLENSLNCAYYLDHPVECRLWLSGKQRLTFSELHSYFERHPDFVSQPAATTGLQELKHEYSELSKAVHGSASNFRMTNDVQKLLLWDVDKKHVGSWATRENLTLQSICLLYIILFQSKLTGAQLPAVREAIGFGLSKKKISAVRKNLKIKL